MRGMPGVPKRRTAATRTRLAAVRKETEQLGWLVQEHVIDPEPRIALRAEIGRRVQGTNAIVSQMKPLTLAVLEVLVGSWEELLLRVAAVLEEHKVEYAPFVYDDDDDPQDEENMP